jgi:hypothetical protein
MELAAPSSCRDIAGGIAAALPYSIYYGQLSAGIIAQFFQPESQRCGKTIHALRMQRTFLSLTLLRLKKVRSSSTA